MKSKSFWLFLGYFSVFLWMIFSNLILAFIFNVKIPQKVDLIDVNFNNRIYSSVEQISAIDDLMESFVISGWAFSETNQNDEKKDDSISIILKGQKDSFETVCTNYSNREDIYSFFEEKLGILCPKTIGFSENISTVEMKDGVYDVYICCRGPKTDSGIAKSNFGVNDVGMQIEKKGGTITKYPWKAFAIDDLLVCDDNEVLDFNVDFVGKVDDRINIWGWALIKNKNTTKQKVYIELIDWKGTHIQYTTKGAFRKDVSIAFDDVLYNDSGFKTSIPLDEITEDRYKMRIIVQCDDKVSGSDWLFVDKEEDNIEWGTINAQ